MTRGCLNGKVASAAEKKHRTLPGSPYTCQADCSKVEAAAAAEADKETEANASRRLRMLLKFGALATFASKTTKKSAK